VTPSRCGAGGLVLAALFPVLVGSCTFEHRPDPRAENAGDGDPLEARQDELPARGLDRSPVGVVRVFREAVVRGDLSLALSLLDREATLVDELAGAQSESATRGELLMELRRRHAEGLILRVLDIDVSQAGETALVLTRLALMEEGGDGIGVEVGRAYETVVLVPSDQGWRIRHVHRSLNRNGPRGSR
jgi:ketosteroid isomerase-like protein